MMTINWAEFRDIVSRHQRFLLTSHIRPDCDALGSELGMAGVLEKLGKDVRIVNGQSTPPSLGFIDPRQTIEAIDVDVKLEELDDIEVMMVLDTSAWAQLGPMGDVLRATSARKLVLDHHVGEDDLGATLFKNTSAEATGRLVAEAAAELGVELTAEIATPLFAAVATDTGWYRFASADADTYALASRLITAGARPDEIYNSLYEQDSVGRLRLRGLALSRIAVEDETLFHTHILRDDFAKTGALPSDTEDLVNLMLGIQGAMAAVIFIEQLDGGFKVSFRSRCQLDCSEMAGRFGGGGHRAAAGAFIRGELDEVRGEVLDAVRQAM